MIISLYSQPRKVTEKAHLSSNIYPKKKIIKSEKSNKFGCLKIFS